MMMCFAVFNSLLHRENASNQVKSYKLHKRILLLQRAPPFLVLPQQINPKRTENRIEREVCCVTVENCVFNRNWIRFLEADDIKIYLDSGNRMEITFDCWYGFLQIASSPPVTQSFLLLFSCNQTRQNTTTP